ncbi:MAG TPA: class A beta-lactamase-related serine hydrolase [Gammaproteobacteria bacterium]|jgi:CubicO group peptidase (beta-lactamase class C family)|nr:class A beta-lactamase-related serine hydrolase [Gammaproteobacteria bacterium]HIA43698.1 class A beta-lactamase-related serine hydrolase [Gammaproteobacteria bacterium]HIG49203.1 class A beta-lactamase-related serine hydrolase [Gammaproteobacteria bacterium]HIN73357.1 class A beta-lactamase-related serine hydrolase [Gammaproteobacteria bacterium]HIO04803.1 class A beta-lactamase-related serine hydrolase [Gammaproteobacteria bacterium]
MEIHGECDPQFSKVKETFEKLHQEDREIGSCFAVYKDGKPLVDLWGGFQDKDKTKPWQKDNLVTVYSTTKGVAAFCIALAMEKGLLKYEEKVSTYWPEFANNGKEDITVGMLMSHQAGICSPETRNVDDYYNQSLMAEKLAGMTPIWEPGTASGYHSMTFGWLTSELILRVTGKSLGTYFREEVGDQHEIDFFIGLPESEDHRVAELVPFDIVRNENSDQQKIELTEAQKSQRNSAGTLDIQNTKAWRQAEIPSANGQGNAGGLAKFYSLIVPEDNSLKLLKDDTVNQMTTMQIEGRDLVLAVQVRWGVGFILNKHKVIYGPIEGAFGHSGYGGSCAFGDPENKIGVSYVMNRMLDNFNADGRSIELINATYECL